MNYFNFPKLLAVSAFLFVCVAFGSNDAHAYRLTFRPAALGASHQYDATLESTWKKSKTKLRSKLREHVRREVNSRGANPDSCDLVYTDYRYSSCNNSGKKCNDVKAKVFMNQYCRDRM